MGSVATFLSAKFEDSHVLATDTSPRYFISAGKQLREEQNLKH